MTAKRTGSRARAAGDSPPARPTDDPRIAEETRRLLEAEQQQQIAEQAFAHPTFDKISGSSGGREAALGMAQRFLCDEKGCPTLVYYQDVPYGYNERMWGKLSDEDLLTLVSSMLYQCRMRVPSADDAPTVVSYPTSQAVVGEVEYQLRRILSIPSPYVAPCRWEAIPPEEVRVLGSLGEWHPVSGAGKMVCRGALVDMMTGEARPNNDVFIPNGPTWGYYAKAPKPERWLAFLDSIKLDAESIGLLQEWFGYVLSGDTWAHKGLIIVGPPRAGKGIIGHVLSELLGRLMVASPALHTLGREFGLEPLLNKRLCLVSDARLSNRIDAAAVIESLLRIVAGDSVGVARKFRDALDVELGVRVMILSNEMPQLGDNSKAINERFLILELTETFLGREDTGLKNALLGELPGIALWAVEGYRRLRARGAFHDPESSKRARQAWFEENNPLAQFIDDLCEIRAGAQEEVNKLYEKYAEWAESRCNQVMKNNAFSRRLVATCSGEVRHEKMQGKRFLVGIELSKEKAKEEEF